MRRRLVFLLWCAHLVSACGDTTVVTDSPPVTSGTPPATSSAPNDGAALWPAEFSSETQEWTVRVLDRIPHDSTAFTQGLELGADGLLEGTGREGESTLRLIDRAAGDEVIRRELAADLFGEGLTVSGDEVIQLTWKAGRALRYDAATLQPVGEYRYLGEGWGICAGPTDLWMSDGTPDLQRRDPETFAHLDSVTVRLDGAAVDDLNELECIGDKVVANVWKSDEILVIEPRSGDVVATIDARVLADEVAATDDQAVLNGIADLGDGTLLLTGKLWPTLFVVAVEPLA